jgi:hypothetical protein
MMEDELIKIWHSSPNQERIKFENSRLILDMQTNLDRFHRAVKIRDLTEIGAAILVIPIFVYQVYAIPFPLSKIASGLIVVWVVYVIYLLRRAKKHKPGNYTETYIDYLHKSRKYIGVQKKLSNTILYWYILPSSFAAILFIIGGHVGGRIDTRSLIIMILGIVVMGVGIYLWNKRAIRKFIIPKQEKIKELLKVMKEK